MDLPAAAPPRKARGCTVQIPAPPPYRLHKSTVQGAVHHPHAAVPVPARTSTPTHVWAPRRRRVTQGAAQASAGRQVHLLHTKHTRSTTRSIHRQHAHAFNHSHSAVGGHQPARVPPRSAALAWCSTPPPPRHSPPSLWRLTAALATARWPAGLVWYPSPPPVPGGQGAHSRFGGACGGRTPPLPTHAPLLRPYLPRRAGVVHPPTHSHTPTPCCHVRFWAAPGSSPAADWWSGR